MSTVGWTKSVTSGRLEDLAWMFETGECAQGAARRLGLEFKHLDKWARRNRVPFWRQMLARNPRLWNELEGRTAS